MSHNDITNGPISGDVPQDVNEWQLFTGMDAFTLSGNDSVGAVALPAPVSLTVSVVDPNNQSVSGAGVMLGNNGDLPVAPGSVSLLGLPCGIGRHQQWW